MMSSPIGHCGLQRCEGCAQLVCCIANKRRLLGERARQPLQQRVDVIDNGLYFGRGILETQRMKIRRGSGTKFLL